ncbi:ABC transporter ATP-binding protein [Actinotignum schaalii]|uniref:ABC transporter ATP-binding protein n=1 Tax=Actinotignum schaalii TaxID=59505 RepID=UPI00040164C7|nr:ABC transporter ATP-binding protein [Actinotignum schaalii]AIE83153.1 iron ABC transporter ATP-binding protein [Actinotignum schaalii]WQN45331.1 ABC transporter ATP-binding protein [Actinotignum schaalii]
MHALLRIFRFTSALSRYYVAVALASILVTAGTIVVPFVLGAATDTAVAAVSGSLEVDVAVRRVILLAGAFLAIDFFSTTIDSLGGYAGDLMSQKMRSILSVRYFDKLLTLPQDYFDRELTGTITSRLNRSIMEVTNFVKNFANSFFTTLLTVIAVLIISFIYSPLLCLLLLIIFPIYMWLTALTSRRWQGLEAQKNEDIDVAGGRFNEVIGQIRVVKSFTRERGELAHFARHYEHAERLTANQSRHWHTMDFLRRMVMAIIFFAIYAIIFLRTARGQFSVGDMVILVQLVGMARRPVMSMSWIVDTTQHAIAGSRDYFEVMELTETERGQRPVLTGGAALPRGTAVTPNDAALTPNDDAAPARPLTARALHHDTVEIEPDVPAIRFENVTFGYGTDPDVLRDVSFAIEPGERVAFVSESGGGKTTLTSLLLGLYEPRAGHIELFGSDIAGLPLQQVRAAIGVVFQDPALFSGTIRENIAYGRPDATEEEILDAASRAHADRFIRRFAQGYDTVIGERGLKLSGGQRQRIAVARAMLKAAPVLVLDEATSALDTRSERWVQAGLEELMKDRTSIIIAHRLSTIASVDRIITLRAGRIDEVGSPAELAESGGIYAELLALQNDNSARAQRHLKRYGLR